MEQREHNLLRSWLKPPPMVNCRELYLFTSERWKAESLLSQWHKPWVGTYPTSFLTHLMPEICYKILLPSFFKQVINNLSREASGNAAVFYVQMKTPLPEKTKGLGSIHLAVYLWSPERESLLYSRTLQQNQIFFLHTNQPLYPVYSHSWLHTLFPVKHFVNEKGTMKGKKNQTQTYIHICCIYICSGTWDHTPLFTLNDIFSPWGKGLR